MSGGGGWRGLQKHEGDFIPVWKNMKRIKSGEWKCRRSGSCPGGILSGHLLKEYQLYIAESSWVMCCLSSVKNPFLAYLFYLNKH